MSTHTAYCGAECQDIIALDFAAGLGHPEAKQYMQPAPTPLHMPLLLFLATSAQLPGWQADPLSGTLERRAGHSSPDPSVFVAGIALILRQFHPDCWQARPQIRLCAQDPFASDVSEGNLNAVLVHDNERKGCTDFARVVGRALVGTAHRMWCPLRTVRCCPSLFSRIGSAAHPALVEFLVAP